jgi:DNA-binding LacI/PurR family transcriptional regulator
VSILQAICETETDALQIGVRCPEEFGLVSVDDYPWLDCFHPRLTTVDLPRYELGAAAARTLLARMQGKSGPPSVVKLSSQLIVRESCGFKLRGRKPGTTFQEQSGYAT